MLIKAESSAVPADKQISFSRQLRKLPRQARTGMTATVKVGSWLSENTKAEEAAEAYDSGSVSDSDAEAEAGGSGAVRKVNGEEIKREEVDWTDVLGKIRIAVSDKSPKRRQEFIGRNLYVTDDCESGDEGGK